MCDHLFVIVILLNQVPKKNDCLSSVTFEEQDNFRKFIAQGFIYLLFFKEGNSEMKCFRSCRNPLLFLYPIQFTTLIGGSLSHKK